MENKMGKVYITGAGCGEADLITLRGMRALMGCDTLVYDSLIARELLNLAPDTAEKIYVGKRGGHHSMSQEEINELLCAKALAGRTVVRLKGGDPYVFGRGSEEILALRFSVMHNLFFYNSLMAHIRDALDRGEYASFRREYSEKLDRRI